ncbi:acireductone synthase [Streptomyces sp. NPDC057702]|uniref:acireductone synthase n=1 Tax=unclassified Streptomyces TaxID=2593676 RepID=UPI0036AD6200
MSGPAVRAVVCDIEGTTGSAAHVREVLFPYARERLTGWLAAHRDTTEGQRVLHQVRAHAGDPELDERGAAAALAAWSDADVKAPPLKDVQGLIWAEGYARGELRGHVYDDVPPALARWRRAGLVTAIYSSGSVAAQRHWFAHSDHGDLSPLLCDYFDLVSAGGKRAADSYGAITTRLGVPAHATLFLSDVREELDAARAAGWQVLGVRRAGDPRGDRVPGHPTVADLRHVPPDPLPAAAP